MRLLRVYHERRRVNTVSPVVQKYCKMTPDRRSFILPSKEEVAGHQVVIATCNTSLALGRLGLTAHFSHIFIDEAAQTLECEAIMPLALAQDNTCVVMAGDHMQMSPKVYSREARSQRFHRSLLERLYHHYETYRNHISTERPLNILLRMNYRTKMEVLRFLSAVFYGGPDMLVDRSIQPTVDGVVPLTFYAAQGRERQDSDSTSYYNVAELEEIVDRVEELYLTWPEEWGPRDASAIGVVSPYIDQVSLCNCYVNQASISIQWFPHCVTDKEFSSLWRDQVYQIKTLCVWLQPAPYTCCSTGPAYQTVPAKAPSGIT